MLALAAAHALSLAAADDLSIAVDRSGRGFTVRAAAQRGEARFFVFAYPIEVRLEVLESPDQWISSRRVAGNLRRLLRYTGELEPDFLLPPLIGTLAVRGMVEKQFAAMVTEIERRAALSQ